MCTSEYGTKRRAILPLEFITIAIPCDKAHKGALRRFTAISLRVICVSRFFFSCFASSPSSRSVFPPPHTCPPFPLVAFPLLDTFLKRLSVSDNWLNEKCVRQFHRVCFQFRVSMQMGQRAPSLSWVLALTYLNSHSNTRMPNAHALTHWPTLYHVLHSRVRQRVPKGTWPWLQIQRWASTKITKSLSDTGPH